MSREIPRARGAIAHFCDLVAVDQVRIVQGDTEVTADDSMVPAELAAFQVSGYGGSALTPAMDHLSADSGGFMLFCVPATARASHAHVTLRGPSGCRVLAIWR